MAAESCVVTRRTKFRGARSQCQSRSRSRRRNSRCCRRAGSSLSSNASSISRRRRNTSRAHGTDARTAYQSANAAADATRSGCGTRSASLKSAPTTAASRLTTWPRFSSRCAPAAATARTSSESSAGSSDAVAAASHDPSRVAQKRSFSRTGARTHVSQTYSKSSTHGSATSTQMNASQEFSSVSCDADGSRSRHLSHGSRRHDESRFSCHSHWPRLVKSPVGAFASKQLCSDFKPSQSRYGDTYSAATASAQKINTNVAHAKNTRVGRDSCRRYTNGTLKKRWSAFIKLYESRASAVRRFHHRLDAFLCAAVPSSAGATSSTSKNRRRTRGCSSKYGGSAAWTRS
mmetsp:Transcript_9170/g.27677  ORF Transcript_9170/g.27677 Transcript_9170/m.27677 type:complete len:346 (-) Transcript_9170:248-1285(-)